MNKYIKKGLLFALLTIAGSAYAMQTASKRAPVLAGQALRATRGLSMAQATTGRNNAHQTISANDGKTSISVINGIVRINGKVYQGQAFKDGIQSVSVDNGKIRINGKIIEPRSYNWKPYVFGIGALGGLVTGYSFYNDYKKGVNNSNSNDYKNGANLPEKEVYTASDVTDMVDKEEKVDVKKIIS